MWARLLRTSAIVMALGALATGQASAQARSAPATGVSMFTARVPSIVRVLVDPSATAPDGAPLVRVMTNDPSLRAQLASGVAPETLRSAGTVWTAGGRGKGSEGIQSGDAGSVRALVRYTIVQP